MFFTPKTDNDAAAEPLAISRSRPSPVLTVLSGPMSKQSGKGDKHDQREGDPSDASHEPITLLKCEAVTDVGAEDFLCLHK